MNILKHLLQKYNDKNSILVISSFPKRNEKHSQGDCGVSSFAKNSLLALQKKNPQRQIVVLAMTTGNKEEVYEENNMLIARVFKRNQPISYFNLLKTVNLFKKAKTVMVEFEFSSFGDLPMTISLVPLIFALRMLNKEIVVVMHQVIFDLNKLSGHIGMIKNSFKANIFSFGLKWFYKIISLPTKKIVVLEEEFRARLSKLIGSNKVVTIPHGVDETINLLDRKKARKTLGYHENDFVILYFGFLTWYKGVDFLINTFKNIKKLNGRNIKILIAGGPSFTQAEKSHYKKFINKVTALASLNSNIKITGFVKEQDISKMYAASDLVTFPYRAYMSSSGPLSLTLSHRKPFILSKNLENLLKTNDYKDVLALTGVLPEELMFDYNSQSLVNLVKKNMQKKAIEKLTRFSSILAEKRSFDNLAVFYEEILATDLKFNLSPSMLSIAE